MKTIRMEQLRETIDPLLSFDLFSSKPEEIDSPSTTYAYLSLVSDSVQVATFQGSMLKTARVSFTIVCKDSLWVNETREQVLFDVVDELNNILAREVCNKINELNGLSIQNIFSDTLSPIFYNLKNRPYIVKDFIIEYIW